MVRKADYKAVHVLQAKERIRPIAGIPVGRIGSEKRREIDDCLSRMGGEHPIRIYEDNVPTIQWIRTRRQRDSGKFRKVEGLGVKIQSGLGLCLEGLPLLTNRRFERSKPAGCNSEPAVTPHRILH